MAADEKPTLGSRTLRGMFWAYGSYVGGRALVLVSTAILARLLSPADFGLVALALIVTTMLETVADLGVTQALIVGDDDDLEERAATAWTLSLLLGFGLAVSVAALAPLAARFFDEPDVTPLLGLLALNFLLRSLSAVHYALAQRKLDFKARTGADLADVVVRGGVGIVLALSGAGAYSLVLGYLAGTAALVIAVWVLVPWRPPVRPHWAHAGELIRFGGTLSALAVIAAAISNVDYVFIGKSLGSDDLGLYTLGFRLPELLILNLSIVAGSVLFPAFAAAGSAAMARAFELALRYTLVLSLPMTAILALLAEPFVLTLFGDQWQGSVEAMQILALYAFAATVGIPAGTAYKAMGRADILVKLAIPRFAALTLAIALLVDQGIVAVAASQAGIAVAFELLGIGLASRRLDVSPRRIAGAVVPSVLATLPMALVLLVVNSILDGVPCLLVGGAGGGIVYLVALWVLRREWLLELRRLSRPGPSPDISA